MKLHVQTLYQTQFTRNVIAENVALRQLPKGFTAGVLRGNGIAINVLIADAIR